MNKFEGIIKKVSGYDSREVKDPKGFEIRRDIRERAKFPPEIQNILSQLDKLEAEENFVRVNIDKLEKNKENPNPALLNDLNERIEVIEDRKEVIQEDLKKILSQDKELYSKFMDYVSKKADEENPEGSKFSAN